MKSVYLMVMISLMLIGCNSNEERVKLNQGLNFEEIKVINKKSLNFNKKNNYSNIEVSQEARSNKTDLQQGCTGPCCSDR